MSTISLINFCILELYIRVIWISYEAYHTLTPLTFGCIRKPTCYMIGFILSSANNQQSVNINWRQTTTKLMALSSESPASLILRSVLLVQCLRGELIVRASHPTHGHLMFHLLHTSNSAVLRLHPGGMSSLSLWKPAVRCLVLPLSSFTLYSDGKILLQPLWHRHLWGQKSNVSMLEMASMLTSPWGGFLYAPSSAVSCCSLWLRRVVGPLNSYYRLGIFHPASSAKPGSGSSSGSLHPAVEAAEVEAHHQEEVEAAVAEQDLQLLLF